MTETVKRWMSYMSSPSSIKKTSPNLRNIKVVTERVWKLYVLQVEKRKQLTTGKPLTSIKSRI